jgi:hypothetical protein
MGRVLRLALLTALLAGPAGAGGFSFSTSFTPGDFRDLADAFGDAISLPNLGMAASTGVAGFEVMAAAGGPQVDTGAHWWRSGVDARTFGGVLTGYRGIVRKGLPWRLDVGAQVGRVAGEKFWGGELRLEIWDGGVLAPAAALRLAYSRLGGSAVALDVREAQLVVSKGFPIVSPYAAAGFRRIVAKADFGDPVPLRHQVDAERWTGVVGARFTLLPLIHVVAEARRGSGTSFFGGAGVGL